MVTVWRESPPSSSSELTSLRTYPGKLTRGGEEGPSMTPLPEGTLEKQTGGEAAGDLLPLHQRECAGLLHHCVLGLDLVISFHDSVCVVQFAKRSRLRIICSFVRSFSRVSGSGESNLHNKSW